MSNPYATLLTLKQVSIANDEILSKWKFLGPAENLIE